MAEKAKANTWGGVRANSGRPKLPAGERKLTQAYSINPSQAAWMKSTAKAFNLSESALLREIITTAQRAYKKRQH